MMDREYEELLKHHSSITDFKQSLGKEALAHVELSGGWVLYEELPGQHKISALLKHFASKMWMRFHKNCLIQFWGVVKEEGRHHYLSSSHHPFLASNLNKGLCWYRKLCTDHEYVVDIYGGTHEEQQLGGVGRVFRNWLPESTPDLRLYSTHEFPMRDAAARCGFTDYMALPLFDSHSNQYYCVLEIIQSYCSVYERNRLLSHLDGALQTAGLRSTHTSIAITQKMLQQPESEIAEVLELAMATIPQLNLAQVWIPPGNSQCLHNTTNLCCMEMVSFIDSQSMKLNSWHDIDHDMWAYLRACRFHKLQVDLHNYRSSVCDLTISENPLAHYAQRARMSHCIAVSHQSNSNQLYVIQFFLRPKYIQDDHSLHLLLRILEINLKSVNVMSVSGKQLVEEYARRDAIECESIDIFSLMKLDMPTYLKTVDSCCLKPISAGANKGWVFRSPAEPSLCKEHVTCKIKEKMGGLMKKIAMELWEHDKWIVQFWALKMAKNRCYLETSDQPYAVGCLAKGIASFRKECSTHYYYVDDQAKQDELGPPGRVFRLEHPEISPNVIYYTREEFPVRNLAMLCCHRGYLALPVFDVKGIGNHKLLGVLEFLGFYPSDLHIINNLMEEEYMCLTPIDFNSRLFGNEPADIVDCRLKALNEICSALFTINRKLSQLHMTNVWVPIAECVSATYSNRICMELVYSTNISFQIMLENVHGINVQARKGIVGMVLASENKSCFCPNSCELSIIDQPLSHYYMRDRRDVCFAICLQSSHTGNLLYVVEFFLYQGPATYNYVGSFLSLLLPILKNELSSFKMACGKELGEELVVEVIEFSDANKLDSSELEAASVYPVIFKSVQYNHTEEEEEEEEAQQNEYHHTEMCTIMPKKNNTQKNALQSNMQKNAPLLLLIPIHEKERREKTLSLSVLRFSNHIMGRSSRMLQKSSVLEDQQ